MPLSILQLQFNTDPHDLLSGELKVTDSSKPPVLRVGNCMRLASCMRSLAALSKLSHETLSDLTNLVSQTQLRIDNLQTATHNMIQKETDDFESTDSAMTSLSLAISSFKDLEPGDDDKEKAKKAKRQRLNFLEHTVISTTLSQKIQSLKKPPPFNELSEYKEFLVRDTILDPDSASYSAPVSSPDGNESSATISTLFSGFTLGVKKYSEYYSNPNFFLNEWKFTQEKRMLQLERAKKQQRLDQKRRKQLDSEMNQARLNRKKKVVQWRDRYNLSDTSEFLSPKKVENVPYSEGKTVGKEDTLAVAYSPASSPRAPFAASKPPFAASAQTASDSLSTLPRTLPTTSSRASVANNRKSIRLQLQQGLQGLSSSTPDPVPIIQLPSQVRSPSFVTVRDEKELKFRLKNILDVTFSSYTFKPPASSTPKSKGFVSPASLSVLSTRSSFYKSLSKITPPPPPAPQSIPTTLTTSASTSFSTSTSSSEASTPLSISMPSSSQSLSPPDTQSTAHISISGIYGDSTDPDDLDSELGVPTLEEVLSSTSVFSPPVPVPSSGMVRPPPPPPPPPFPAKQASQTKSVRFSEGDKESWRQSRALITSMRLGPVVPSPETPTLTDSSSTRSSQEEINLRPTSSRHLISKSIRLERQQFATLLFSVHGYIEQEMALVEEPTVTRKVTPPPPPGVPAPPAAPHSVPPPPAPPASGPPQSAPLPPRNNPLPPRPTPSPLPKLSEEEDESSKPPMKMNFLDSIRTGIQLKKVSVSDQPKSVSAASKNVSAMGSFLDTGSVSAILERRKFLQEEDDDDDSDSDWDD